MPQASKLLLINSFRLTKTSVTYISSQSYINKLEQRLQEEMDRRIKLEQEVQTLRNNQK